ncbi:hypothetical protein KTH73_08710 [Acinetobacter courvalinii]|uniref:Uncharacterized protein n=1 Tax=Acinetobacter courvalinii TaxID=280147 RepID=N9NTZ0_9GAMM|nr:MULTISPECIES: hypothetical protein [Acinetobacter]EXB27635.1 hypothetical protein J537_0648 [Acinetobacter baumannii 1437282]EXB47393.1 hypothetical protein J522_2046 [Acinetobacter baumannii 146457]RSN83458.1 hypothetical protein EA770_07675 [Acinetobacter baumannii]ENX05395.1 hypothetical protein F898_02339 [Acinetobacter courvalinii]ENX39102.1 hypothetical protein F888_01975 [Acinetobacter courvalinii]
MNEEILLPASRATAISNANVKKLTVDKILSKISSTIKLRANDGDRDALQQFSKHEVSSEDADIVVSELKAAGYRVFLNPNFTNTNIQFQLEWD